MRKKLEDDFKISVLHTVSSCPCISSYLLMNNDKKSQDLVSANDIPNVRQTDLGTVKIRLVSL